MAQIFNGFAALATANGLKAVQPISATASKADIKAHNRAINEAAARAAQERKEANWEAEEERRIASSIRKMEARRIHTPQAAIDALKKGIIIVNWENEEERLGYNDGKFYASECMWGDRPTYREEEVVEFDSAPWVRQ